MAKWNTATESSPAAPPPSLKKSTSGSQTSKNQKSILGFFQKKSTDHSLPLTNGEVRDISFSPSLNGGATKRLAKRPAAKRGSSQTLTPVPSSDAAEALSPEDDSEYGVNQTSEDNGLPSPITPFNGAGDGSVCQGGVTDLLSFNSPSRKVSI